MIPEGMAIVGRDGTRYQVVTIRWWQWLKWLRWVRNPHRGKVTIFGLATERVVRVKAITHD